MLLYKYVDPDGIDLLKNLRLLVKGATELNDPFEFLPTIVNTTAEELKKAYQGEPYSSYLYGQAKSDGGFSGTIEKWQERMRNIKIDPDTVHDNLYRIIQDFQKKSEYMLFIASFCHESIKPQDDVLMWAHYSDNAGMRIAFETDSLGISSANFVKVEYADSRLTIDPLLYLAGRFKEMEEQYRQCLRTKSASWAYEQEYRWYVHKDLCSGTQRKYVSVPSLGIVSVDLGVRADSEFIRQVASILSRDNLRHIALRKAVVDEHSFRFNYQPLDITLSL